MQKPDSARLGGAKDAADLLCRRCAALMALNRTANLSTGRSYARVEARSEI